MKSVYIVLSFTLLILISTFLSTILIKTFLFIHTLSYVLEAFGICLMISIIWFLVFKRNKKLFYIDINFLDISILLLGLYLIERYFLTPLYNSQPDLMLFSICLIVCYFFFKLYLNGRDTLINIILYLIILTGLFQLFYGLLQIIGIVPELLNSKQGGTFGNSGDLTNFLVVTYTLSLGLFLYEKKIILRYLLLGSIIMHLFVIVISFSRTSWISCFVTSLMIAYHFKLRNILIKKYFLALIFIIFIGIWGAFELYNFKSSSADGRLFIWQNCLQLIKGAPLFGHGYQSFFTEIRYAQISYFKNNLCDIKNGLLADNIYFAYNDYLQITVEYGIVALMMLLFTIYSIFSFKNTFGKETKLNLLTIVRVSIIAILISMLFSYPLQNQTILICFLILIVIVSVYNNNNIILKIELKRKFVLIGAHTIIIFSILLIYHATNSITNGHKWEKAFTDYEKCKGDYITQYNKLFNVLKNDRSFIMNYGFILHNSGNYVRCIDIYEKYGYLCLSSDMYIIFGESYEKIKNYTKAEENYKNASFLVPHLFIPKYKLFKLYRITNQPNKADSIAQRISSMKIKIYSEEVRDIKTEINWYLLSKKQGIKNE